MAVVLGQIFHSVGESPRFGEGIDFTGDKEYVERPGHAAGGSADRESVSKCTLFHLENQTRHWLDIVGPPLYIYCIIY